MIRSPNTRITPPPTDSTTAAVISVIVSSAANNMLKITILSSSLNYSFHNSGWFFREWSENQICLLSKQVSHRSLGSGFIFSAHIIWRIVTVGNTPSIHSPERSSNRALNFGCRYNESVSHGSISLHHVCLVSVSNRCWITARPRLPILNSVHVSYIGWSQICMSPYIDEYMAGFS